MTPVVTELLPSRPYPKRRGFKGSFFYSAATTTDPKKLGVMYLVTSFAFFMLGGLMALLIRTELAVPGLQFLSNEQYNQLFTMHGTIMLLLYATPIVFGFANYILPLQIGAPDVAFPRLNALSYWLYLFGALITVSGFLTPGGARGLRVDGIYPADQCTAFTGCRRRSVDHGTRTGRRRDHLGRGQHDHHRDLSACARDDDVSDAHLHVECLHHHDPGVVGFSHTHRSADGTARGPDTSVDTSSIPPQVVRSCGNICSGSSDIPRCTSWPYRSSVSSSEIFPVFSRKPIFGYAGLVYATIAISALSAAVWAHHMFATGAVLLPFFSMMSFLIAIPTGVKFFNWIGTMWKGQLTFESPMLFSIGFLITFLFGGLSGVILASPPLDFHVTDSYFLVAHIPLRSLRDHRLRHIRRDLFLVPEDHRTIHERTTR